MTRESLLQKTSKAWPWIFLTTGFLSLVLLVIIPTWVPAFKLDYEPAIRMAVFVVLLSEIIFYGWLLQKPWALEVALLLLVAVSVKPITLSLGILIWSLSRTYAHAYQLTKDIIFEDHRILGWVLPILLGGFGFWLAISTTSLSDALAQASQAAFLAAAPGFLFWDHYINRRLTVMKAHQWNTNFLPLIRKAQAVIFSVPSLLDWTKVKIKSTWIEDSSAWSREEIYSLLYELIKDQRDPFLVLIKNTLDWPSDLEKRSLRNLTYESGMGVRAEFKGHRVLVGSRKAHQIQKTLFSSPADRTYQEWIKNESLCLFLAIDEQLVWMVSIDLPLHSAAVEALGYLKRDQIRRILITSGDTLPVFWSQLFDDIHHHQLPLEMARKVHLWRESLSNIPVVAIQHDELCRFDHRFLFLAEKDPTITTDQDMVFESHSLKALPFLWRVARRRSKIFTVMAIASVVLGLAALAAPQSFILFTIFGIYFAALCALLKTGSHAV